MQVEEDGDEIFTPVPTICPIWTYGSTSRGGGKCGGAIVPTEHCNSVFMICVRCKVSWSGPLDTEILKQAQDTNHQESI